MSGQYVVTTESEYIDDCDSWRSVAFGPAGKSTAWGSRNLKQSQEAAVDEYQELVKKKREGEREDEAKRAAEERAAKNLQGVKDFLDRHVPDGTGADMTFQRTPLDSIPAEYLRKAIVWLHDKWT